MDIKESLRRILEQKQAVTRRFFTITLNGCHDAYFVLHSEQGEWGVPLTIHAEFTNDLLRTLQEFHGADWDPELMEKWRTAIERVGRALFTRYQ